MPEQARRKRLHCMFCGAKALSETTEGVEVCNACDERQVHARDRLLALIARQQRQILEQQQRLLDRPEQSGPAASDNGDRLCGPADMANLLGKSPEWWRQHADELGGWRPGDGPKSEYVFYPPLSRERFAALAGTNNSTPGPAPRSRRQRRRRPGGGVELLPIKGKR